MWEIERRALGQDVPRRAKTSQDTIARGEVVARGPTCRPRVNDPCYSRLFMTSSDGADSRFRPTEVGLFDDASFDARRGRGLGQPPHCAVASIPGQGWLNGFPGKDAASSPITKEPPHHPAGVARSHQAHARARRSLTASMPFPCPLCSISISNALHIHGSWAVHGPSLMGGAPCGARAPQGHHRGCAHRGEPRDRTRDRGNGSLSASVISLSRCECA